MTEAQQTKRQALTKSHRLQLEALSDSLGTSDQYAAYTERILRLIARQIGEDRQGLDLTPIQLAKYDRRAEAWLQRRKLEGYSLTVPDVK